MMNHLINAFSKSVMEAPLWAIVVSIILIYELTHLYGTFRAVYIVIKKIIGFLFCPNKSNNEPEKEKTVPRQSKIAPIEGLYLVGKEGNYPLYHINEN